MAAAPLSLVPEAATAANIPLFPLLCLCYCSEAQLLALHAHNAIYLLFLAIETILYYAGFNKRKIWYPLSTAAYYRGLTVGQGRKSVFNIRGYNLGDDR